MRFKNYQNSYTNDNRIYSKNEMLDMTVREIKDRAEEFIAQHRVLGLPDEEELRNSSNVIWINEYTRDDGTKVSGHWRSLPNGGISQSGAPTGSAVSVENNESTNYEQESYDSEYDAEEFETIKAAQKYEESEEYKKQYREREKQKSIERKDPDEIAGVKRGEPKTFFEMMQQGVNPNFSAQEDIKGEYSKNCQSCNVACELVIRGYDVEASPYNTPIAENLGKLDNSAYFDPKSGLKCVPKKINIEKVNCFDYINETVKIGERYEFAFHLTPNDASYEDTESHTVFLTRMGDGKLLIYDGQKGEIAYDTMEVKSYIESNINEHNTVFYPRLLRVDDKKVNPYYTDKVVRASGKNRKF